MTDDHQAAAQTDRARNALLIDGAQELPSVPWRSGAQPPSDGEFLRYAAWRARRPDVDPGIVASGLSLLEAARAELDQIEAGLLFAARADGLTFQQIAEALGLGSAQAAQQRMNRVSARAHLEQ